MKLPVLKLNVLKLGIIAILLSINILKAQTGTTLNFDGANDYVNCGTAITSAFTGLNKITVEAWVNPSSNSGYGEIAGNYNNSAGNMQFLLRRDFNNFTFWTSNGSFTGLTSAATVTVGTWTHLAGTWDGSVMSLYVNGILSGTTTASGSFPSTSNIVTIGGETASSSGTEFFVGSIDEVRIWNNSRSSTQVQSDMTCELGVSTAQPGLIAYYNFNEGIAAGANPTVTTLLDNSGNFINGGLNNFALSGPTSNWISGSGVLAAPGLTITGSSALCAGSPSLITETVSGASTYTWSTGSNATSISVTPTASTTYTVLATAANSCTNSASKSVYFYPLPVVSASSASTSICSGQSSTITAMPGVSYGLNFNGSNAYVNCGSAINSFFTGANQITVETWVNPSTNSGLGEIVGNYNNNAGNMQFLLRRDNNNFTFWTSNGTFTGLTSIATVTVGAWTHLAGTWDGSVMSLYVNGILSGTTAASGSFASTPNIVTIGGETASSSGVEFFTGTIDDIRIWSVPRSQSAIAANMNNCLNGSEAGLVTLYNMNNGPGSSILSDLTSNATTGTLTNMNTTADWVTGYNNCNMNYLWSPTAATTQSIAVTPSVSTVYTVNVTSFVGCSKTATASITVNTTPTLAISGSTAVCNGNSAVLTGSGANTYTWSTSANTTTISVSPTVTTTYSVAGTSTAGCTSTVSATKTVSVNALPTLSISASGTVLCSGQTASLTGSGANTYTWSTSANTTTISVSPTVTTTYSLTGTNAAGCTNSVSAVQTVSVNALPSLTISASSATLCSGQTASLTGSGANTYTWSTSANTTTISVSPTVTTTYSLTGTTAAGCINSVPATQAVTVNATPTLAITGSTAICNSNSAVLTGSGANTYTWSTSANTTTISVSPTVTTTYSVTGTSATGCTSSVSAVQTVSVNALPTLIISSSNTVLCSGQTASLTGSGANTYTWSTSANTTTISVSPAVTTTYSLTGTSAAGCTSSVSAVQTVSVNALPTLSVSSSNTLLCSGQTASLTANGASTYTWSTGANTSSIAVTPSVTTSYTVSGTSAGGCSNLSILTQSVSTCTGIEEIGSSGGISVYPNPNNGSFNINITTLLENGELVILNAIGQKIYSQVITQGTNSIRTSDLAKGLYHYQVLRDKQVTGMGKLIIE